MSRLEVLITENDIRTRIREMADVITEKYAGEEVLLLGILNGSAFFMTELARLLGCPVEIDFMAASSYGGGTQSSGHVIVTKDLERPVEGRHVIVVEDIIDTGRTIKLMTDMLLEKKPASLEVAALLDKPDRRIMDFQAEYVGFEIPDVFVVGWGLDIDQKYRDLAFIGVIEE